MSLVKFATLLSILYFIVPATAYAQDFGAPGVPAAVMTMGFAASSIVRATIDAIRTGVEMPRWMPILLVFILSPLVVGFLIIAGGTKTVQTMTQAEYSTILLAGILAASMAVLNNTLASKAVPTKPPAGVAAAPEAPMIPGTPGATRAGQ